MAAEEDARNKEAQLDDALAELRECQEEASLAKQAADGMKAELLGEREHSNRLQQELNKKEAARLAAVKAANEAAKAAKVVSTAFML